MLRTSETVGAISLALCNALVELEDVKKEGSANIPTKSGGSFSYKYATLPNILQSVRGTLGKHDLAVVQNATTGDGQHVYIWTMLIHASGEYMVFDPLPMPIGNTAQETGSAITYGRRYHLLSVLGLAADDDDDGVAAAPREPREENQSPNRTFTGTKTITNKLPGKCFKCGGAVNKGAGLASNDGTGWKTLHVEGECLDAEEPF